MKPDRCRLGVCDPRAVPAMALVLSTELQASTMLCCEAGPVDRDSDLWHALREAAPNSGVWKVLEEHPEGVLVVAITVPDCVGPLPHGAHGMPTPRQRNEA